MRVVVVDVVVVDVLWWGLTPRDVEMRERDVVERKGGREAIREYNSPSVLFSAQGTPGRDRMTETLLTVNRQIDCYSPGCLLSSPATYQNLVVNIFSSLRDEF